MPAGLARQAESEPTSTRLLVVFHLSNRRYAVDLAAVERVARIVDITPLPHAPEVVVGVIDVHGRVTPVVNVRKRLGLPERALSLSDRLLVARTAQRTVALVADAVSGVIAAPSERIAAAQTIVSGVKYLAGVLKLDDGLVLIHDLTRFLSLEEEAQLDIALRGRDERRV